MFDKVATTFARELYSNSFCISYFLRAGRLMVKKIDLGLQDRVINEFGLDIAGCFHYHLLMKENTHKTIMRVFLS